MYYFQQFPITLYTFDPSLYDFKSVVNVFTRVDVISAILQNSLAYYEYNVKDSDTAEIIAFKYYGDPLRSWMIFFANQIIDPYFDMPLKERDLENNLIYTYGSLANAQATLYRVIQYMNVTTTYQGTTNTISYVSTLEDSYTYNFSTNQLEAITLPNIAFPIMDQGSSSVSFPDGTMVTTDTMWVAQSAYDYYIQQNEDKRKIQLLDKQYAGALEQEFAQLMSS
jgi:hypothetical protein